MDRQRAALEEERSQVQKIAGHRDIATTMRYVHTDGIKNTASRQWTREARKALKVGPAVNATPEPLVPSRFGHLRVVNSADA